MGAFLEKPKTDKTTVEGEGYGLRYGVSAMQGWRMEMEDSHICMTDFSLKNWSFFGVFDGHAGPSVSLYSSQHILENILSILPSEKSSADTVSAEDMKTALEKGFVKLDQMIRDDPKWANGEDHSGTTAVTVMISPTHIIWANCGDSRGFLCRSNKVEFATEDHKPYLQVEKARIEKAGGTVMMQRVNGSLAVSRALGDFDYKRNSELRPDEQLVSPVPDVTIISRDNSQDEFLLLACDGIYDVMTNEEVLAFVRHRLELTSDLKKICSDLIDYCLNKNSRDNMSVVLVVFPNAPQVSKAAIEQEEKLQKEAEEAIKARVHEMVEKAQDPLEVEENYVIQQLDTDLPANYDVHGKRPFVAELLQNLTKSKFGETEKDFTGPSDPNYAPSEFTINTRQGEIHISSIMEQESEDILLLNSNDNPVTEEGEDTSKSDEGEKMEVTEDGENVSEKLPQEGQPSEAAAAT